MKSAAPLAVGAMTALLLFAAGAAPAVAQFATINFPDTPVGSTATVKCPDTSVSICFGTNCAGSGTVQSVTGPSAPFSASKFSLLSVNEFFAGSCEAHPVTLPVTVGPGQVLAYQVTFAPTAGGTFDGSLSLNTAGGPATVNLHGKGLPRRHGGVLVQASPEALVPGELLTLQYQTAKGTLDGNVDVYLVVVFPDGSFSFVTEQGTLSPAFVPLRRNVAVTDATFPLFADRAPLDLPFGTYAFYMALVYAGADAAKSENWASPISSVAVSYAALSPEQTAIKSSRGNPDLLVVTWLPELNQKQETWMYLAGSPNRFTFVNGKETGQSSVPLSPSDVGAKVDPALFTPQTTLASLTAALGPPTSVTGVDGAPEFQHVNYAIGLDVILRNGRLSSALTSPP
jgi:hypothetical protein